MLDTQTQENAQTLTNRLGRLLMKQHPLLDFNISIQFKRPQLAIKTKKDRTEILKEFIAKTQQAAGVNFTEESSVVPGGKHNFTHQIKLTLPDSPETTSILTSMQKSAQRNGFNTGLIHDIRIMARYSRPHFVAQALEKNLPDIGKKPRIRP